MLSDLAKSASDLRQASTKALEQLAEATVPRLRPVLDEVVAVRCRLEMQHVGTENKFAPAAALPFWL